MRLSDVLRLALARRRLVLALPLLLALATGIWGLLRPRTWSASASFTPQSSAGGMSRLAGLAAQFGVNVPMGGGAGLPADFYADLLRSDAVLRDVVTSSYSWRDDKKGPQRGTLMDHYRAAGGSLAERQANAVERLRERIEVSIGLKTGIVRFSVHTLDPGLSQQVAGQLISRMQALLLAAQQGQASQESRFASERLAVAQRAMQKAENALEGFLLANRVTVNPRLAMEEDRLRRDVLRLQQIVASLQQAQEQARLDEVRNTPSVLLLERPVVPGVPDRRLLIVKVTAALAVGVLLALAWVVLGAALAETRANPRQASLVGEIDATLDDLRHPWRLLRKVS